MSAKIIAGDRLADMIRVKRPQVWCYKTAPLYLRMVGGEFVLYKESGMTLEEMGINSDSLPQGLYILSQDRLGSVPEVQICLRKKLDKLLAGGDPGQIKNCLVQMVEEALADPRAASLHETGELIHTLTGHYAQRPETLIQLAMIAHKDYTTAVHSVNLATLTLAYCLHYDFPAEATQQLGLGALLHDLGKLFIPSEILGAPRKLTDQEFAQIKTHPSRGHAVLRDACFGPVVLQAALEHHEKLDGSGYPRGKRNLSLAGRLIGLLDAYEALTSDERVYRKALEPFACLNFLKDDVAQGKLDRKIFESFTACLA